MRTRVRSTGISETNTWEMALGLSIMATVSQRMKPMRSIWQSCSIIVGIATDEQNIERDGEVNGTGSLSHKPCT
jgi:hypothetical protein